MNPLERQLQALVKCLTAQKIKYVILGGIAVSIYGEPRLTADIDVNIIFDKRKINEFLKRVKKYGFYPSLPNTRKIVNETGVIPMGFKRGKITGKIDIIIAENLLEYTAIKRGKKKKIGSLKAKFIRAEDLVIHKIASSRARDFEDLKGILIRQRGKLDTCYIRHWLKRIDKANKKSKTHKLFIKLLDKIEHKD